jgi:hypothetical protein
LAIVVNSLGARVRGVALRLFGDGMNAHGEDERTEDRLEAAGWERWQAQEQHVLWSLGYVEGLEDEGEIGAAAEVARQDCPEWWRAA